MIACTPPMPSTKLTGSNYEEGRWSTVLRSCDSPNRTAMCTKRCKPTEISLLKMSAASTQNRWMLEEIETTFFFLLVTNIFLNICFYKYIFNV